MRPAMESLGVAFGARFGVDPRKLSRWPEGDGLLCPRSAFPPVVGWGACVAQAASSTPAPIGNNLKLSRMFMGALANSRSRLRGLV
jgi:hypothetical protein